MPAGQELNSSTSKKGTFTRDDLAAHSSSMLDTPPDSTYLSPNSIQFPESPDILCLGKGKELNYSLSTLSRESLTANSPSISDTAANTTSLPSNTIQFPDSPEILCLGSTYEGNMKIKLEPVDEDDVKPVSNNLNNKIQCGTLQEPAQINPNGKDSQIKKEILPREFRISPMISYDNSNEPSEFEFRPYIPNSKPLEPRNTIFSVPAFPGNVPISAEQVHEFHNGIPENMNLSTNNTSIMMSDQPEISIQLFPRQEVKNTPSAIIHHLSYLSQESNSKKLLVMDPTGSCKQLKVLDNSTAVAKTGPKCVSPLRIRINRECNPSKLSEVGGKMPRYELNDSKNIRNREKNKSISGDPTFPSSSGSPDDILTNMPYRFSNSGMEFVRNSRAPIPFSTNEAMYCVTDKAPNEFHIKHSKPSDLLNNQPSKKGKLRNENGNNTKRVQSRTKCSEKVKRQRKNYSTDHNNDIFSQCQPLQTPSLAQNNFHGLLSNNRKLSMEYFPSQNSNCPNTFRQKIFDQIIDGHSSRNSRSTIKQPSTKSRKPHKAKILKDTPTDFSGKEKRNVKASSNDKTNEDSLSNRLHLNKICEELRELKTVHCSKTTSFNPSTIIPIISEGSQNQGSVETVSVQNNIDDKVSHNSFKPRNDFHCQKENTRGEQELFASEAVLNGNTTHLNGRIYETTSGEGSSVATELHFRISKNSSALEKTDKSVQEYVLPAPKLKSNNKGKKKKNSARNSMESSEGLDEYICIQAADSETSTEQSKLSSDSEMPSQKKRKYDLKTKFGEITDVTNVHFSNGLVNISENTYESNSQFQNESGEILADDHGEHPLNLVEVVLQVEDDAETPQINVFEKVDQPVKSPPPDASLNNSSLSELKTSSTHFNSQDSGAISTNSNAAESSTVTYSSSVYRSDTVERNEHTQVMLHNFSSIDKNLSESVKNQNFASLESLVKNPCFDNAREIDMSSSDDDEGSELCLYKLKDHEAKNSSGTMYPTQVLEECAGSSSIFCPPKYTHFEYNNKNISEPSFVNSTAPACIHETNGTLEYLAEHPQSAENNERHPTENLHLTSEVTNGDHLGATNAQISVPALFKNIWPHNANWDDFENLVYAPDDSQYYIFNPKCPIETHFPFALSNAQSNTHLTYLSDTSPSDLLSKRNWCTNNVSPYELGSHAVSDTYAKAHQNYNQFKEVTKEKSEFTNTSSFQSQFPAEDKSSFMFYQLELRGYNKLGFVVKRTTSNCFECENFSLSYEPIKAEEARRLLDYAKPAISEMGTSCSSLFPDYNAPSICETEEVSKHYNICFWAAQVAIPEIQDLDPPASFSSYTSTTCVRDKIPQVVTYHRFVGVSDLAFEEVTRFISNQKTFNSLYESLDEIPQEMPEIPQVSMGSAVFRNLEASSDATLPNQNVSLPEEAPMIKQEDLDDYEFPMPLLQIPNDKYVTGNKVPMHYSSLEETGQTSNQDNSRETDDSDECVIINESVTNYRPENYSQQCSTIQDCYQPGLFKTKLQSVYGTETVSNNPSSRQQIYQSEYNYSPTEPQASFSFENSLMHIPPHTIGTNGSQIREFNPIIDNECNQNVQLKDCINHQMSVCLPKEYMSQRYHSNLFYEENHGANPNDNHYSPIYKQQLTENVSREFTKNAQRHNKSSMSTAQESAGHSFAYSPYRVSQFPFNSGNESYETVQYSPHSVDTYPLMPHTDHTDTSYYIASIDFLGKVQGPQIGNSSLETRTSNGVASYLSQEIEKCSNNIYSKCQEIGDLERYVREFDQQHTLPNSRCKIYPCTSNAHSTHSIRTRRPNSGLEINRLYLQTSGGNIIRESIPENKEFNSFNDNTHNSNHPSEIQGLNKSLYENYAAISDADTCTSTSSSTTPIVSPQSYNKEYLDLSANRNLCMDQSNRMLNCDEQIEMNANHNPHSNQNSFTKNEAIYKPPNYCGSRRYSSSVVSSTHPNSNGMAHLTNKSFYEQKEKSVNSTRYPITYDGIQNASEIKVESVSGSCDISKQVDTCSVLSRIHSFHDNQFHHKQPHFSGNELESNESMQVDNASGMHHQIEQALHSKDENKLHLLMSTAQKTRDKVSYFRIKAHLALWRNHLEELFNILEENSFPPAIHKEIQDLWIDGHSAIESPHNRDNPRPLRPNQIAKIKEKYPYPPTIFVNATQVLNKWYQADPYPKAERRNLIAKEIGYFEKQVNTWFKNRRQREKRNATVPIGTKKGNRRPRRGRGAISLDLNNIAPAEPSMPIFP